MTNVDGAPLVGRRCGMVELVKATLVSQFEASLCMMGQCIAACPEEHWEGKIANGTLRWAAYHTLFFTDFYLSRGEGAFELREMHARGGDEREPVACVGLGREETLAYCGICREKAVETIAGETVETLQGGSGFSWLKFSRLEAHVYNIRHIQHHTGQMSAYLRKVVRDAGALKWVGAGWKAAPGAG